MTDNLVYIANSGDAPHGITVAELDYNSGTLSPVQQVTEISECHYLNSPSQRPIPARDDRGQRC